MKKVVNTLIILVSITCFSQNFSKKTQYYFKNNEITKAEFESLDIRKIYTRIIENDSIIIKNTYPHKNIGKLDSIQLHQIRMLLKRIIGSEFNQKKNTMIHLYKNKNVYKDSKYKKYWKWIKKNSNRYQSFLIGTKDSQIAQNKMNHIYLDRKNLIEKLFFKSSDFKINHLMIKPNGAIYVYFGLNDILQALDWSVD